AINERLPDCGHRSGKRSPRGTGPPRVRGSDLHAAGEAAGAPVARCRRMVLVRRRNRASDRCAWVAVGAKSGSDAPARPRGAGCEAVRRKIVTIVDDRITNLKILERLARSLADEIVVRTFDNPLSALAAAAKEEPDLVITDFKMPELDGAEFIRRFR